MKAELNISLTFEQLLSVIRRLPREKKIRLSRELEKEAVDSKLSDLLKAFRTNELSQEAIDRETEAVRKELYGKSKKR